jgi:hypothetical protein
MSTSHKRILLAGTEGVSDHSHLTICRKLYGTREAPCAHSPITGPLQYRCSVRLNLLIAGHEQDCLLHSLCTFQCRAMLLQICEPGVSALPALPHELIRPSRVSYGMVYADSCFRNMRLRIHHRAAPEPLPEIFRSGSRPIERAVVVAYRHLVRFAIESPLDLYNHLFSSTFFLSRRSDLYFRPLGLWNGWFFVGHPLNGSKSAPAAGIHYVEVGAPWPFSFFRASADTYSRAIRKQSCN